MFTIERFEEDFHSLELLKSFCGEEIQYKYNKRTDTMHIDVNNMFENCEELYETFLSDSRNILTDEEDIDCFPDETENADYLESVE